jgi:hypothetical protein
LLQRWAVTVGIAVALLLLLLLHAVALHHATTKDAIC